MSNKKNKQTKCEMIMDHDVNWAGDGYFCSKCMLQFSPKEAPNEEGDILLPLETKTLCVCGGFNEVRCSACNGWRKRDFIKGEGVRDCCNHCTFNNGFEYVHDDNCPCHSKQEEVRENEDHLEKEVIREMINPQPSQKEEPKEEKIRIPMEIFDIPEGAKIESVEISVTHKYQPTKDQAWEERFEEKYKDHTVIGGHYSEIKSFIQNELNLQRDEVLYQFRIAEEMQKQDENHCGCMGYVENLITNILNSLDKR